MGPTVCVLIKPSFTPCVADSCKGGCTALGVMNGRAGGSQLWWAVGMGAPPLAPGARQPNVKHMPPPPCMGAPSPLLQGSATLAREGHVPPPCTLSQHSTITTSLAVGVHTHSPTGLTFHPAVHRFVPPRLRWPGCKEDSSYIAAHPPPLYLSPSTSFHLLATTQC